MRFRAQRHGSVNQGYFPIEETSEIHPDLVEGWVWCRRAFDIPQRRDGPFRPELFWPRPDYEPQFRQLALAHEALFKPIAQAMLQGIGCDPHAIDAKLTNTNFGLRANYYPPMSAAQDRSGAGRLLGHEDVDLFTILPGEGRRAAGVEPP
jgi:isopenicillin N synthase-like dioxygenase